MALKVGELFATLGLDDSDFNKGLSGAESKSSSMLSGLAKTAGGVAAGIIGAQGLGQVSDFLRDTLGGAAIGFEKQISAVGAVAGATKPELDALADAGMRIGKETAFSASEAAQAMEILAANGVSTQDILGGAADAAVALAAAGGTDLVTAADLASTSMSVWGLKASDMTDVVNRMAGAANVSRFGVEDMALAVAQGGGAAASAGVEFGDFTTAIAAIAPSFSSGSDAGTSFKQFLAGLTPTGDKAKDAMRELGLITEDGSNQFFDAAGNIKSMAEITDLLNKATSGLSEQQKAQALETIFGSDAMRAAAAISKLTGDEFTAMDRKMRDADAAAVAAQRMDNAAGAIEQLKGSIEVIEIEIGRKLTPAIQAVAMWLAEQLPRAFDAAGRATEALGKVLREYVQPVIERIIPAISELADAIESRLRGPLTDLIDFIASHQEFLAALGIVVGVTLVAAFIALGVAIAAALAPILITTAIIAGITAAATALVAGIIALVKHWDEVTARVPFLGAAIDAVASVITDHIMPALDALADYWRSRVIPALQEAQDKFENDVFPVLERLGDVLEMVGELLVDWVELYLKAYTRAIQWAAGVISDTWDELYAVFKATFDLYAQIVETGMEFIRDTISIVMALIRGDWDGAWNGVKTLLSNVWENIRELIDTALKNITTRLDLAWALIKAVTGETWNLILDILSGIWDKIGAKVSAVWDAITKATEKAWNTIKDGLQKAWDAIKDLIDKALDSIGDAIEGAWNLAKDITEKVWGLIKGFIDREINGWKVIISTAMGLIGGVISGTWDGAKRVTETVLGTLTKTIPDIFDDIRLGILGVGQRIINALGDVFGRAKDMVASVFGGIAEVIKRPINTAIEYINRLIYAWNGLSFSAGGGSVLGVSIPKVSFGTPDINPIPYLAQGTRNFPGGLAVVGDRGPELLNLPRGANVYSNSDSRELMRGQGPLVVHINAPHYVGPEESLAEPFKRLLRMYERTGVITKVLR